MTVKLLKFLSVAVGSVLVVGSSKLIAQSSQSVTLEWDPSASPGLAGYIVLSGAASGSCTNATDVGNQTNATVTGLVSGQTYFFAVRAYNVVGLDSAPSSEVSYQIPAGSQPPALPLPWQAADIGNTGLAGSANAAGSLFTVQGSGNLSGTADNFHFVYQTMSGNGEIHACIGSTGQTGTGARAGVMIRETLASGSRYAFMGISPTGAFRWQRRSNTSSNTSATSGGTGVMPNTFVRLVRTNSAFYGYSSMDGSNWTQVNSRNISMAQNIYIGLAVASGSTNVLNTSTFSNVVVVP